jgi:hypothetical protein
MYGPVHLPGIAPHNITLYAGLRLCHSILALLLFLAFTAHMCAILFHTLVLRDGMINRMALWPVKHTRPQQVAVASTPGRGESPASGDAQSPP